jgi:chromosome segregation ATPase
VWNRRLRTDHGYHGKKQQISAIQSERIDPLLKKIDDIENQKIGPIEREIRTLEKEKDNLFKNINETRGEKAKEMDRAFKAIKAEQLPIRDQIKNLNRQYEDLMKNEGAAIKMQLQKASKELEAEQFEIQQKFKLMKQSKTKAPSPEMKKRQNEINATLKDQKSLLRAEADAKRKLLSRNREDTKRKYRADFEAKRDVIKERIEQLRAHSNNLSTQARIEKAEDNIAKYEKRLQELGPSDSSDDETLDSLQQQLATTNEQLDQTEKTITDPKWTEKLTDGSLTPGTPEYDTHIKNETKIQNPDWKTLDKTKNDLSRKISNKESGKTGKGENDDEQRARNLEQKVKYEAELDELTKKLTSVEVTAVDTSTIDGEIESLKANAIIIDEQIAAFPESDKTVQDPAWTEKLMVLTTELDALISELTALEQKINAIEVFIDDPDNPGSTIQNPEYTSADENYAAASLKKAEKQQEYEAHLRNQGEVVNADYQALLESKTSFAESVTQKNDERNHLLSGGTAGSSGLPTNVAAVKREIGELEDKRNLISREYDVSKVEVDDKAKELYDEKQKGLKKELKESEEIVRKQYEIEKEKIREEFNKKPEETLVLEERLREIRDERRAIKDKGGEIKEDLAKQGMVIKGEKRLLEEEIDKIQDREMDLRDSRGTFLQEIEPIQEKIRGIEGQIKELFTALDEAYEEKKQTQNELKQVEREIETLAREAESDVLTIISDAMKAAEELENSSPLDFSQFQAIGQED